MNKGELIRNKKISSAFLLNFELLNRQAQFLDLQIKFLFDSSFILFQCQIVVSRNCSLRNFEIPLL